MINISEFDKTRWKSDGASKTVKVTFPDINLSIGNDGIIEESLEITQVIEDGTELSFTGCHASQMQIEFASLTTDVRNQKVVVTIQADGTDELPLFVGYVSDQRRSNHEDLNCTIKAFDVFSKWSSLDVSDWFNKYQFPATLLKFRTDFAVNMGVDVITTNLIFDTLQLSKTVENYGINALTIVKGICQLNGVFGRINNEGKLEFVSLGTTTAETISRSHYISADYEDYSVNRIDKVQIRESEDDIGGIYGNGTNAYIVEANWMAFGRSGTELTQMAERLYQKVSQYTYMPAEIELIGLPYLECGDCIETDTDNSHITTYILSRTLKGITGLSDEYKAEGSILRSVFVADVHEEIKQLKGKSNTLSRTVEETKSQVTDLEKNVASSITQLSDSVKIQIDGIYNELDGSITTYNTNETPTLLNYPAWDFTYNIPCNNTVKTTNDLKFVYKTEYYARNSRAIAYDTVQDVSYRFKKSECGIWYWEEVAESDFAVAMKKITALEVKDGEITSSIEEISADINDLENTTESLSSRITQTVDAITAEVTRASTAEDTLSSRITQTADSISTEVNRAKDAESSLLSRITQTADAITAEVTRATNYESELSSRITQTADAITSTVKDVSALQKSATTMQSDIKQTADTVSTTVKTVNGLSTDVSGLQTTTSELSSTVTQTATEIKSKVSAGDVCSVISQSSDAIEIKSNRISIASTNFSLSKEGNLKASNVELSGKITATSGSFGGMTINNDGLFYDKWFAISPKAGGLRIGNFTTDSSGKITANAAQINGVSIENLRISASQHSATIYSLTAGVGGISSSGKISTTSTISASGNISTNANMSCYSLSATSVSASSYIMGYTTLRLQSLSWKYVSSLGGCVLAAYSGPTAVMGA